MKLLETSFFLFIIGITVGSFILLGMIFIISFRETAIHHYNINECYSGKTINGKFLFCVSPIAVPWYSWRKVGGITNLGNGLIVVTTRNDINIISHECTHRAAEYKGYTGETLAREIGNCTEAIYAPKI